MSPVIMNTQLTALRKLSSCDAGKGTQVEPSKLHGLRKQSWDSEESEQMETTGQSVREERTAEKKNSRDMQRIRLESLAEHWFAQACLETTWDQRKNHPKGLGGYSAQSSHRVGNSACAHQADLLIHEALGRVLRKVWP